MVDLKPCPFCGGNAEELDLEDEANFGGSVICCQKCGASSPVHFDRKENLYDSWNRRTEAKQDDEPRAYIVHAPEDDCCGTGPDALQFHPLAQHDIDNGYRQTPLYGRPTLELSGNGEPTMNTDDLAIDEVKKLGARSIPDDFVEVLSESYTFYFEDGRTYTPSPQEQAMLADFGHSLIAEYEAYTAAEHTEPAPAARSGEVKPAP